MAKQHRYVLVMMPLLIGCGFGSSDGRMQSSRAELDTTASTSSLALQKPEWDQTIAGFAGQLADQVARDDVGGIAVGVVVDGDLVWAQGFGWADRDDRVPMAASAVLRTGSISRSVTAMLLMRLVDRGVVGLDEPVERYLPEFASVSNQLPGDPEVTFRHLASHTAGLERNYREGLAGPIDQWQERVIQSLENIAFDSMPGTRYQDSPVGYGALGLALERAAGKPFVELVQTEVFDPLGMTGSSFVVESTDLESRLATGYPNRRNGTFEAETPARQHGGWGYTLPSGGMYSTVADLGRFLGAIAGVPSLRILSESSREEMISVQTPGGLNPPRGPSMPPDGPRLAIFLDGDGNRVVSPEVLDPPYGLGLAILVDGDGNRIVHNGGIIAGYTAYMAVDTETRVGVVMLRNYWRGTTNLRRGTQGLVSQLSALARERGSLVDSLLPILIWVAGALLVGALLNVLLGTPNAHTRRR